MTIHWKAVNERYFIVTAVYIYPVCNFGNFINFGLGTLRSERIKILLVLYSTAGDLLLNGWNK